MHFGQLFSVKIKTTFNMKSLIIRVKQTLLVLLSWAAPGFLLYSNHKLLLLLLLVIVLAFLTYFVYRKISRQSMLIALVIMLILEALQFINDYQEVQETGVTFNQLQIINYILPFSVIFTIVLLLLFRKNEFKQDPKNKI